MEKFDFNITHKEFYDGKQKGVSLITVPKMNFISIRTMGHPQLIEGKLLEAIEAIFHVAFKTMFEAKEVLQKHYKVFPLEGMWFEEDGKFELTKFDLNARPCIMQIAVPDFVPKELVIKHIKNQRIVKNDPIYDEIEFVTQEEGKCLQIVHKGPFSEVLPTIELLESKQEELGLVKNGYHHGIYLKDLRSTNPDNFVSIIRQPVK